MGRVRKARKIIHPLVSLQFINIHAHRATRAYYITSPVVQRCANIASSLRQRLVPTGAKYTYKYTYNR